MARPSIKKKRFASLYVHGPERGNWAKTSELAGYKDPPSINDAELRDLIAREGGTVPEEFEPVSNHHRIEVPEEVITAVDPDAELRETQELAMQNEMRDALEGVDFPEPGDPNEQEKWVVVAQRLTPIYKNIATGWLDANQGQRMVLQNIMDRAYGKAGQRVKEEDDDSSVQGVVLLPVVGHTAGAHIEVLKTLTCSNCGEKVHFIREEDDASDQ